MKKFFTLLFLLAVSIPAHAEWKLDLLWQAFTGNDFSQIELSPNDSSIFTLTYFKPAPQITNRFISKIHAKSGNVYETIPNKDTLISIKFSKDGSYLSASGTKYMGFVDTNKLEYFTKIDFPNIINHHYNENKGIMTGFSKNTIRQYDTKTKALIKEYDSSYFKIKDVEIIGVALPNVEDRFVYSFIYSIETGPKPGDGDLYYGIRVINSEGKILFERINKNFHTDYDFFSISNDGTKVAYFYNELSVIKIAVLDLTNLKEANLAYAGQIPNNLIFSRDDKYLYNGNDESLIQIDVANLKSIVVHSGASYRGYKINSNTSAIYRSLGSSIKAYKIDSKSGVVDDPAKNTFKVLSSPNSGSLQINFQLTNSYLLNMRIYNSEGRLINEIENKNYNLGEYTKNYNIQNLPNGAYYIQIKLNNEIYPQTLNFVKVN